MENTSKLVYGTCKLSHLITILLIINLKTIYGWKNDSVDELLALLHQLLPPESTLQTKESACKTKINNIGLKGMRTSTHV